MGPHLSGVFGYLPSSIQERCLKNCYQNKKSKEFEKFDHDGEYSAYYSGWTLFNLVVEKNQCKPDVYLSQLLEKSGIDVEALRKIYGLTPPSVEAVYKDYYKYLVTYSSTFIYSLSEKAAIWQYFQFSDAFGSYNRMDVLSIDDVLPFIERQKSATTFLNKVFKNKGQCIDSEEFRDSYCRFLYSLITDEQIEVPKMAVRKEEIRLMEKINEGSQRSFILSSLYYILTGHQCYLDFDVAHATKWFETRTGMGMSLFNGQYEKSVIEDLNPQFKFFAFKDVGKWDSRTVYAVTETLTPIYNQFYPKRIYKLYELLGSWSKNAVEIGIPDIDVDTYRLRYILNQEEARGPVVMPRGEIMFKGRGTDSGTNRTTPKNVDVHDNFLFQGAIDVMGSYSRATYDKFRKNYVVHHTGDDEKFAGVDGKPYFRMLEIMKSVGWEIDGKECSTPWEMEYLSCKPAEVEVRFLGKRIVPVVNSAKVIASLCDKMKVTETLEEKLMRICAARLLCCWTADSPYLEEVNRLFLKDNPQFLKHTLNKSIEELRFMYFGSLESLSDEMVDLIFFVDQLLFDLGGQRP